MITDQCVTCGKEEKPLRQGMCQAHYRQSKRRERGLRSPGPAADPTKPYSHYNPDGVKKRGAGLKDVESAKTELLPPKQENNKNKTHCKRGHEYTSETTRMKTSGIYQVRCCKPCEYLNALAREYGLSEDDFLGLLEKQSNRCGICEQEFNPIDHKLKPCVDHCHSTGEVRGILCNHCNRGLGLFGDDPARLARAITFLVK